MNHRQSLIHCSICWYITALVIAQAVAPPEYRWLDHTVSELAAQGYPLAWIMRLGLIGFGALLAVGLVRSMTGRRAASGPDLLLTIYAVAILGSGLVSTAPFVPGTPHSTVEAYWHSVLASAAGFAISASIVWRLLSEINPSARRLHLGGLTLVTGISALFGLADAGWIDGARGLLQRLLHIAGLAWVWIAYRRRI
jgi:hypothetical membrane protein